MPQLKDNPAYVDKFILYGHLPQRHSKIQSKKV